MAESGESDSVAEGLHRVYVGQVQHLADRLRRAADDLERRTDVPLDLRDLLPDYLGSAQRITHDIQSMMGNLHLDSVLRAATDADRYVREAADHGSS